MLVESLLVFIMLYFGDYGMNHAKTIPISLLFYIKPHTTLKNRAGLQSFKLIIYSYSKIKPVLPENRFF